MKHAVIDYHLRELPSWIPAGGITTGKTIWLKKRYLDGSDPVAFERILRHELVHVQDQVRFGLWFWLSYLLLLPIGPSFKAYWEWRAYREDLRWAKERYGTVLGYVQDQVVSWLSGPLYLWACPEWLARKLVDAEVRRLG